MRESDVAALFSLFADWEVDPLAQPAALALYPGRHAKLSFVSRPLGTATDAETRFAITLEQTPIGSLSVRMRPASHLQRGDGPNLGYWLGLRYRGHGYMTEALRGVVDHLFSTRRHDAIYCGAFVGKLRVVTGTGEGRVRARW